jgi:hypothetical protein
MAEPKAEQPESMPDTKSGICTPAGYNGKEPKSIDAPVKSYPGSGSIGKGSSKTGGMIEGPASGGSRKR